jgi:hypothetical protein
MSTSLDTTSTVAVHTSAFSYNLTSTPPATLSSTAASITTTLLPLAYGKLYTSITHPQYTARLWTHAIKHSFLSSSGHPPPGHILALFITVGLLCHAIRSNPSVLTMDTACHLHISIVHRTQTPSRSSAFLILPSQYPFH